ncbi:MAG: DedA family protein [Syntrophales bacterium]|jgi:membrane protein YqaA with SNARE-associated domain|nr:DedA family protein [Syntrophales bacterium]MCK9528670.1 DedA family protein [Syntrophales bacterium]MDX9922024.1 YqaA family protein [Syntrophales bacterium]
MIRRLYDWVLHWAETPYGSWALFFLAFSESSFFPIPPDVLLIALALSIPARAFKFALICTAGSVLGGIAGYAIGYFSMQSIGMKIIVFYGLVAKYEQIARLFDQNNAWIVFIAGFTPLPYKVITITAGAFSINFPIFVAASAVGRMARFFLVGALIYRFGPAIRAFIDRYFNLMTVVFTVLLLGGFIVLTWLL